MAITSLSPGLVGGPMPAPAPMPPRMPVDGPGINIMLGAGAPHGLNPLGGNGVASGFGPTPPPMATVNQGMPVTGPAPGAFGSLGAVTGMTGGAPHPMLRGIGSFR